MCEQVMSKMSARADAYALIATFLALPNKEVAEGVGAGALFEDARALSRACGFSDEHAAGVRTACEEGERAMGPARAAGGASSPTADGECVLSALRRDYTHLFTNPEQACVPVYEACFKGTNDFDTSQLAFISPTALDAERAYKAWGLAASGGRNESPDHMGMEAEFMGFLYAACARAKGAQEEARVVKAREALADFADKHFLKWGEPFFERVAACAQTTTYRCVGELGVALACSEREALAELAAMMPPLPVASASEGIKAVPKDPALTTGAESAENEVDA